MKTNLLLMGVLVLYPLFKTYAQTEPVDKKNFMKNYQAPDFKVRSLNFSIYGGSSGITYQENSESSLQNTNQITYGMFSNQSNYQGNHVLSFSSQIRYKKNSTEQNFSFFPSISQETNNRFYWNDKWFFGLHNRANVVFNVRKANGINSDNFSFRLSPVFSVGVGRVEPVQYARNAMDIERLLNRGERLNQELSPGQLNTLANRLAEINNVRFYDFRLRRIEQFEELDKTIRDMGIVNEFDIRYFSHLSDAYLYALNNTRQSGMRQEFGLVNNIYHSESLNVDHFVESIHSLLFYNFEYYLPQSYAVQHSLRFSFSAGFEGYRSSVPNVPSQGDWDQRTWTNLSYTLGLFPTTRTGISFSAAGGLSDAKVAGIFGLNGYYYFSPRARLSLEGRFTTNEENYDDHSLNHILVSTYARPYRMQHQVSLRFNYAIF